MPRTRSQQAQVQCRRACCMQHVGRAGRAGAGARLREDDGPAAAVQVGRHARQQLAPPAVDVRQVVRVCGAQAHRPPARHLRFGATSSILSIVLCARRAAFLANQAACTIATRSACGLAPQEQRAAFMPCGTHPAALPDSAPALPTHAGQMRACTPGLPGATGRAHAAAGRARQGRAFDEASHQGKPPKSHCQADHRSAGSARDRGYATSSIMPVSTLSCALPDALQHRRHTHASLLAKPAMHARHQNCT